MDREKGKLPSLNFKDLVAQTFYNQGVLLRIQRLVFKGTTERAEEATQLVECFPSMYKVLRSVPSAANESTNQKKSKDENCKKARGKGENRIFMWKGTCSLPYPLHFKLKWF